MDTKAINRRKFLRTSAAGAFGAGILPKSKRAPDDLFQSEPSSKIKEYRILGRTGFRVSDISSGICLDVGLLNAVLDTGINYIDTAENYGNEHIVGQAIQNRDRKSLFITTKLHIKQNASKQEILDRTKRCLGRLKTDYIDCMMIHSCPDLETLKTKGFHAAIKELKTQGRLRFVGVSNHGVSRRSDPRVTMERVLLAAAEDGRFDVFLLAHNFLNENNGSNVLQVCKEKNIGTTIMKANPIGLYLRIKEDMENLERQKKKVSKGMRTSLNRLEGFVDEIQPFVKRYNLVNPSQIHRACIQWTLNNTDVNTVCCRFQTFDHLDNYVPLSGTKLTASDAQRLDAYKKSFSYTYCRHGCGACEPNCPENVPVNTIMRYNHYFVAQGREKEAMLKYAALNTPKADQCQQCSGHCEAACPYSIPVQGLLVLAHNRLILS